MLSTAFGPPHNSYNAVRLIAALSVVLSHSLLLGLNSPSYDPLSWAAYDLGATAVNVFFVISGAMLTHSVLERGLGRFVRNRFLRIYPALIVSAAFVALLIGPFATDASLWEYYSYSQTWFYPLNVAWNFEGAALPSMFEHGRYPGNVNVPLWTIKYEILSYIVFGTAAAFGFLRYRAAVTIAWAVFGLALFTDVGVDPTGETPLESLFRFAFAFLTGVLARRFGEITPLRFGWAIAALALAVAGTGTRFGEVTWIIGIGYAALYIGAKNWGRIAKFARRHDLSYGIYLMAWPVQQVLTREPIWLGPQVAVLFLLSSIIAGSLAYLSWNFVERPTLRRKAPVSEKES
ncbi:acyltransferase family protein [Pelagibacterium halotolerans]|uniref:Acyltransferase family protein n=1 Tax=Pelagibacterium halotolerans (strain DSM 22347 / JCM 15775 / CGMCC 1.7692 / B2) TaxID=1082931 RepID=G4RDV0_PELHB|nr:acyltransferase [Pelagibacterium halotolerans]AEQ53862.1 acyltransferase family protein [Pelagibacterium halotolerans B2]QJR19992.1 acyltransferase [Pelagibacterium halotolerans]